MDSYIGNHREIGDAIGKRYLKSGTNIAAKPIDHALLNKQIAIYKRYYPEKLDELTAISKAAGFDTVMFLFDNICFDIMWHKNNGAPTHGCTIFGVKNDDGLYVGRNYDWKPGTEKVFRVIKTIRTDAYTSIGITDMDYFAPKDAEENHLFYDIDDAINNKGLYIGLTFAYHDGWNYGISPIHMNQLVSEKCQTVAEALQIFEKTPLSVPKNFFIADRHGDMAVIEHTSRKYRILRPINGILVKTNHYLDPDLQPEDTVLAHNELSSTFKRYAETLDFVTLNKDHIHQLKIEQLLKDPTRDVLETNKHMKTIWSLAMDMTHQSYRLYWNYDAKIKEEKLVF